MDSEGRQFADTIGCAYLEVSARTGEHIEELFRQIGELAEERLKAASEAVRDDVRLGEG